MHLNGTHHPVCTLYFRHTLGKPQSLYIILVQREKISCYQPNLASPTLLGCQGIVSVIFVSVYIYNTVWSARAHMFILPVLSLDFPIIYVEFRSK